MANQTKKIIPLIATVLSIGIVSYALQKTAIADQQESIKRKTKQYKFIKNS